MIVGISNIHTGDLVLPGLLAVGLFLLGYLGKTLIDLWISHMRYQSRPELLDEYADLDRHADDAHQLAETGRTPYAGFDDLPEIAPEDEPSWPGKVSPPERHLFALAERSVVVGGNPASFDLTVFTPTGGAISDTPPETPEETSGRHALIPPDDTATGLIPAVADNKPVAEEVGVS